MITTKIVSKQLIKPYSPTPQNLKNYKLSFIDELSPRMEVGVLLFYSSIKKPSGLQESLAKILVKFYPLAGRYIKKYRSVDCSDQGAEFIEAKAADVELKDVVAERNLEELSGFFPFKNHQVDEGVEPILSVQLTELNCGAMVIGISVSHRVFDASSLGTFIAAWSQASNLFSAGEGEITINPNFDALTLFPSKNNEFTDDGDNESSVPVAPKPIVKRFSFSNDAITRLRSKSRPNEGKQWISRVRLVSAAIAKALIGMDREKYGGESSRPSITVQAINMRERTIPPLSKHACGNLAILSCMTATAAETETEGVGIQELVSLAGYAIDKSIADCKNIFLSGEDGLNDIIINPVADAFGKSMSGEANVLWFSDWSKFGFYEADFGWGKPVWTTIVPLPNPNTIVLMDSREGNGIEAWVHLDKNDMPLFEQDQEIRVFAT